MKSFPVLRSILVVIAALWISVIVKAASGPVNAPAGITSWWQGETNAIDAYSGLNGTLQGGALYGAGQVGQAFSLLGTNDYVEIPDNLLLSPHVGPSAEMTVEAWIFLPELPTNSLGQASVINKGEGSTWEYALNIHTNGAAQFSVWQAGGAKYVDPLGGVITTGIWHHVAGTLKKSQFVRVYLDGQKVAEATTFAGDTSDTTAKLYIGGRKTGEDYNFNGLIDEVSLYARALSDSENLDIYNAGSSGKTLVPRPVSPSLPGSLALC